MKFLEVTRLTETVPLYRHPLTLIFSRMADNMRAW